jgi:hypothetical protein
MDSSSLLTRSTSNESFGFSTKNVDGITENNCNNNKIVHLQSDESSSYMCMKDLINLQYSDENLSTPFVVCDDSTEKNTSEKISNELYPCKFISKYNNEYNSSSFLSKRIVESSDETISSTLTEDKFRKDRKKFKTSSSTLSNTKQHISNDPVTTVGTLNLTWPRYIIKDGVYAEHSFNITNTCPVDTGLFILYHAYKANTDEFRNLFETNTLEAFITLRRTFQYVENDNWTVARLYWLVKHDLLTIVNEVGQYDLMDTLTKIVFDFVKPMQQFQLKSQCTCTACPKSYREHTSSDIQLR